MNQHASGTDKQPSAGRRGSRTWRRAAAPLVCAAVFMAAAAGASAQSSAAPGSGWTYELTPYLWMSGIKGDTRIGDLPTTSADVAFTDLLDNLDFGIAAAFEARRGRWGFLFDGMYFKISASATASRTGSGPVGSTATANANLKLEQTLLAGAAAYRIIEGRNPVDLIGGLRYSNIKARAEIEGSFFNQSPTASRSGRIDWLDPYVGIRAQSALSDRWTIVGYADVGGFGAGSDVTVQAIVGFDYAFSKTMIGKFGYRYLKVDYDKDGFVYDMETQGPYLGLALRF